MHFLQLLFQLLHRFVPVEEIEFQRLQSEAKTEWDALPENPEELEKGMLKKAMWWLKKHNNKWQVRVLNMILYIVLTRVILDFMNPKDDDKEDGGDRFK